MNSVTSFLVLVCFVAGLAMTQWVNNYLALVFFGAAIFIALSLKMANAWEKFVILRMGSLQSVKGSGLFVIIPVIDNVIEVIDGHIQTTEFNAEQALTRDTVPFNVDAIIFWHVHDAEQAGCGCSRCRNVHRHVPDVRGPAGSRAHAMLGGTVDLRPCGSLVPGRERSREGRAHQMAPPYCSGPMKY